MEIFSEYWGLTKEETERLISTGAVNIREFGRRQVLMGADGNPNDIGIILTGTALLESANMDDQRRILDFYEAKDLIWRKYFPDSEKGMYYISNHSKCKVAFMNYERLSAERSAYGAWMRLLDERILDAQQKSMVHVDILGQRTSRQKLLSLFGYLSRQKGSFSFRLPFSLTDCADYLAVDRSAMMRELAKMKEEGLVNVKNGRVQLMR